MSQRRTVILLVAIVVGVLAAFLLFNYVRGIEDRANEGAERVEAFRARDQIPRGTEGEAVIAEGSVEAVRIPQDIRPATAITSLDEISLKVALFNIAPNTVIVQDMFVDRSAAQIGFRQRLKNPDHTAITIDVGGARGVAGLLVPTDEVNMMVFEVLGQDAAEGEEVGPETTGILTSAARYLYQDVQIIAVGRAQALEPGETAPEGAAGGSSLLTLAVPPRAAQWIASFDSNFYLTLTPEDYVPRPIDPLPADLAELPGESADLLTPYCGPDGDGTLPCPPPPDGGS